MDFRPKPNLFEILYLEWAVFELFLFEQLRTCAKPKSKLFIVLNWKKASQKENIAWQVLL